MSHCRKGNQFCNRTSNQHVNTMADLLRLCRVNAACFPLNFGSGHAGRMVRQTRFGRYGYRRITALLKRGGWKVNHKRVERIWRREGLKVPGKQPRRARLWLNDGSCIRLRPERPNHVWAYDFVLVRTRDGRALRLLTVIDEYTRECLAIRADRHIRSCDVIETLTEVMVARGVPDHIRSDNGPEFTATAIREWLGKMGAKTLYIEPGSP